MDKIKYIIGKTRRINMFEFITVRELYEMFLSNQMMDLEGYEYVELEGWVRTNRNNGKLIVEDRVVVVLVNILV